MKKIFFLIFFIGISLFVVNASNQNKIQLINKALGAIVTPTPTPCPPDYFTTCQNGTYSLCRGCIPHTCFVAGTCATPTPRPTATPAPTCGCNANISNCCNRSCTSGGLSCTCYGVCSGGSCSTGGVVPGSCSSPSPTPYVCSPSNCSGPSACVESGPTTCEQYTTACRSGACTYGPHASCTGCTHSATPPPTPVPTVCTPTTSCAAQGANCGSIWNGCSTVGCGTCGGGQTCSGNTCVPSATTYSISGNVYIDTNRNGAKDPGETNSSGRAITVSGTGGGTSATAASGNYSFAGVASGSHTVTLTVPAGNSATTTNPTTVTLGPSTTVNFGYAPTVAPTPTPVGSNIISGNVFVDANKNQLLDIAESDYSGGTSTINIYQGSQVLGSPYKTVTTNNGIFTTGNVLPVGTYAISYTGLSTGYQMTVPINGPPPAYTVTVGNPGCSVGGSNSATCDANGDIANLNFGITNSIPWCQSSGGGDIGGSGGFSCTGGGGGGTTGGGGTGGAGGGGSGSSCVYDIDCVSTLACNTSGSTCACGAGSRPGTCTLGTSAAGSFNDPISSTALAICGGPYASIPGNTSITSGLIFTGNGSAYFGQGSASLDNWLVGGTNYPASFGPVAQGGLIKTSYAYLQSIAKQADITPIDLNSDASLCSFGGLTNCKLSLTLTHGIYVANGDLTLTGNGTPATYTFPSNQSYIILVHGNLTIQTQLHVPAGSTALFSASGNITVDKLVGEQNYQSSASDIEGIFSADQNFNINGQNDCTIGPDFKLNVAGSIITNAALNGGTFINQRDLCENNIYCPVFTVQSRPDFILNAPDFIKKANYTWQEVAP